MFAKKWKTGSYLKGCEIPHKTKEGLSNSGPVLEYQSDQHDAPVFKKYKKTKQFHGLLKYIKISEFDTAMHYWCVSVT